MSSVRRIISFICTGVTALAVTIAVLLAFLRLSGYRPYSILSGSMTPVYSVGDLVYVKKADFSEIEKGDVITFVIDEKLNTATHRVEKVNSRDRTFVTKGDANTDEDASPVLYENVVGTVRFKIPVLGYAAFYLSTLSGRFAIISVFLALALFSLIDELLRAGKKEKTT